ncbi:hypothetical protein CP061683_0457B, partial [Chlamydia psittaci 06-1683]
DFSSFSSLCQRTKIDV